MIFLLHKISFPKSFLNALAVLVTIYQSQSKHSRLVLQRNLKKKTNKVYAPFLWIGFNCLAATEQLRGDSILFTNKFPGVPGAHSIHLEKVKG